MGPLVAAASRTAVVSVPRALASSAAASAGLLYAGLKIHHDYAIAGRLPSGALGRLPADLSNWFQHRLARGERHPRRAACRPGPARDVRRAAGRRAGNWRTGTYRYAWTQGIGRVRWTVAKLALPRVAGHDRGAHRQPAVHLAVRPVPDDAAPDCPHPGGVRHARPAYAAWTLTAFCLGAFLGTLIGRVLPAMAASLGCFAALAAVTVLCLQQPLPGRHVLAHAALRVRLAPRPVGAARRGHRATGPPPRRLTDDTERVRLTHPGQPRLRGLLARSASFRLPAQASPGR